MSLSTRIEQAGEGSFVLDCEVHRTLYDSEDPRAKFIPKPYTTSLDAAMMLVPDGWVIRIKQRSRYDQTCWTGDGDPPAWVVALFPDDNKADDFWSYKHGSSTTPALALCAAALRARNL